MPVYGAIIYCAVYFKLEITSRTDQNRPHYFECTWNALQIYVIIKIFPNEYIDLRSHNLPFKF